MRSSIVWSMAALVAVACAIPDVEIVSSFGDENGGASGSTGAGGRSGSAGADGGGTAGKSGGGPATGGIATDGGAGSSGGETTAGRPNGGSSGHAGSGEQPGGSGPVDTGGAGGAGGVGPVCLEPPASISKFDVNGATTWGSASFNGSFLIYPSNSALTSKVESAAWHVSGTVSNYSGFVLSANNCADASSFSGVRFSIKGSVGTSGQLTFMLATRSSTAMKDSQGTCEVVSGMEYESCHSPSKTIAVTSTAQTVQIAWSDLKGGAPMDGTDGSDVIGLEWGFAWVFEGEPYAADVTIDNVEFF